MTNWRTTKQFNFSLRELPDNYTRENFFRLKQYIDDLNALLLQIETAIGEPVETITGSAASAPRLLAEFVTDTDTQVGDLVVVNGDQNVTRILNNKFATMPAGIFGICHSKLTPIRCRVMFVGSLDSYSGLTTGSSIFVSTSGTPTNTAPSTGISHQIGFAISPTEVFFFLQKPFKLASDTP